MPKTILIIEDDVLCMKLFTDLLQSHGFDTIKSFNGMDALQLSREHSPDLIIMDIQLPKISGIELTRMLKTDDELKIIPILAVTAFAMKGDKEKILDAGCNGYISKPISVPYFIDEIKKYLSFAPFRLIETLITGHPVIDAEHEDIVTQLNNIKVSLETGQDTRCTKQVDAILTAIKHHFKNEEIIMNDLGYDDLESHRVDHEMLLKSFDVLINDVAENGYAKNFFNKLTSIVVHDMIRTDIGFKNYLDKINYQP